MPRLIGFLSAPTKARKGASTEKKTLGILEKQYIVNNTKYGELNTTEQVDGLISSMLKLPQTPDVQTRILELQAKKAQFIGKQEDLLNTKNVFDADLQDAIQSSTRANFKDPQQLIASMAAIYTGKAAEYQDTLYTTVKDRYGSVASIPAEATSYGQELDKKAKMFASLFNAYSEKDASGNLGNLDPNGFAVRIDTNPLNGKVQNVSIVPSDEVNADQYMRTEVGMNVFNSLPNNRLPIYLRTYDGGVTKDGKKIYRSKIGSTDFEAIKSTQSADANGESVSGYSQGLLTPVIKDEGFWGNFKRDTPEELSNDNSKSLIENGLNFNAPDLQYDNHDVPRDRVARIGGDLYYTTPNNDGVLKADGRDINEKKANMARYLQSIGRDPKLTDQPFFTTRDYLQGPQGTSRVQGNIDANYFSALPKANPNISLAPPPAPSLSNLQSQSTGNALSPAALSSPGLNVLSGGQVNTPNRPDAPKESSGGTSFVNDIIEKGKNFFRNPTA